jgi:uncharacterized protein DUF3667
MSERCPNCSTSLVGEYCHACGQRRIDGRLTVKAFLADVTRRVFRFDKAFVLTFWRLLREPGALVADYLEGRRQLVLDPIHFFISSVFVQFMIAAFTRSVAPLVFRTPALGWLERLGGVVAVKILVIFWMVSIWRLLFRPIRYNLAEVYVFATYVFGSTGLLWAVVPIIDLIVPVPLGANRLIVASVTLAIELVYTSYAVAQFARLPLAQSVLRVGAVLALGYGVLIGLVGVERAFVLLFPPMPAQS